MNRKFALLLDGGFVLKKLHSQLSSTVVANDIETFCNSISQLPELSNHELLRIYFYHAPPASGTKTNPLDRSVVNFSNTPIFNDSTRLISALELKPNFALRLGKTATHGWKLGKRALQSLVNNQRNLTAADLVPDIQQKGVDLRIGLDIARLALRQLVDVIVVVTGDSDFVPAFKFARREGLRVYLHHMGHGVNKDLKIHVDLVL